MKKIYIILFTSLTVFYSCQNGEVTELKADIIKLKEINKQLKDSLNNFKINSINNSYLMGIPQTRDFKLNELARIQFGLFKIEDNEIFNIYTFDRESKKRVLIEKDWNEATYMYEFIPKTKQDGEITLIFEFDISGEKIEVPASMSLYFSD